METLLGIVMLAAPLAAVLALAALVDRRRSRCDAAVARQVALTDALHARLGGALAPFVRRRPDRWEIAMAVPFEKQAVVAEALTTVDEMFGRAAYEVVLSRQPAPAAGPRAHRAAPLGKESLSWT
jgi:hypothetical protein